MPGSGGGDGGGLVAPLWSAMAVWSAGGGVGEADGKVMFNSLMLGTGAGRNVGRVGCGGLWNAVMDKNFGIQKSMAYSSFAD